jgi:hypothetical protein
MLLRVEFDFVSDGAFIGGGVATGGGVLEGAETGWFVLSGPKVCA